MTENAADSKPRTSMIVAGFLAGLFVLLFGLYLADVALNRGTVARGTTVGEVEIGGMEPEEAVQTLSSELGGVSAREVTVTAGERSTTFIPAKAGIEPDWPATVEAAGKEPLNPFKRIAGIFGTREVEIVSVTNDALLGPSAQRVANDLHVDPADGLVAIEAGNPKVTDPKPGQDVNRETLREEMSTGWLSTTGVEVEPEVIQPAINQEVIDEAVKGPVNKALSGPLTLHGQKEIDAVIDKDRIGEIVFFRNEPAEHRIVPGVRHERAAELFGEQLEDTVVVTKNATISSSGEVTPHEDGNEITWDSTLKDIEKRIFGDDPREWDAQYREVPATFTTEQARKATFKDEVGTFTTGDFESASGKNIEIVARQVDGAIVSPGQTFSLNGYTGPRGEAQGYVESGIIIDGRAGRAVGGGISQFATTLYNASYFAGMTDVAHTPHSYYISRYPAGREATVYEGAIDLVFKNDTPNPVKIVTEFGRGKITVKMMGTKDRKVESINGGRWAETPPTPQKVPGPGCVPSGGSPGFTTSDTRVVTDLSGREISRETTTTIYDPQPIVKCD